MSMLLIVTTILLGGCSGQVAKSGGEGNDQSAVNSAADRRVPKRFVIIISDALRADHLGAYGSEKGITPKIDALAEQSVVFKDVVAAGSWTLSSNPGFFTGLYPYEVFDYKEGKMLDEAMTLAEYFQAAGYKTAAFSSHPLISNRCGFDQGFDLFVQPTRKRHDTSSATQDNYILSRFSGWINSNSEEKYFVLLYLHDPHQPYDPESIPDELSKRLEGAREFIQNGEVIPAVNHRKPIIVENPERKIECSWEEIDLLHALYDGDITEADMRVGKALEAIGEDEDTVIVFASDHGEEWMEHGGLAHNRQTLYDELLRIPLLLKIPGRKPESVERLVSNLDVMPTLLELAKIEPVAELRGRSLFDMAPKEDRALFSEARFPGEEVRRYGVRVGTRTAIHTLADWESEPAVPKGGGWEYYDLVQDPIQQNSLNIANATDLKELLLEYEQGALFDLNDIMEESEDSEPGLPEDLKRKLEALGYVGGLK